jgi:hypothetical protein
VSDEPRKRGRLWPVLLAAAALLVAGSVAVPVLVIRLRERAELERGLAVEGDPERAVVGAMKTIVTSEMIFREGDKDGNGYLDYGSLAQLGQTQLVDEVLGSGTKYGYLFEAHVSPTTSEFLWFATATPIEPGHRTFFVNHGYDKGTGVLWAWGPIEPDRATCEPPPGLEKWNDGR